MNQTPMPLQLLKSAAHIADDPWLCATLLQKSIRRGEQQWGLVAAQALMDCDPDRLMRRMAVIAVEDVGIAGIDVVSAAVSINARWRRDRAAVSWETVSGLVNTLCASPKCRCCDDLYGVSEYDPTLQQQRIELAGVPVSHLQSILTDKRSIVVSAIAARYMLGTNRWNTDTLAKRRGKPAALFDHYLDLDISHVLVESARDGYKTTRESLFGLFPLIAYHFDDNEAVIQSDGMPQQTLCNGVPSWSLDYFTRRGRKVLSRFLRTNCPSANWIKARIPGNAQTKFLGGVLFAVESGLVKDRLIWPVAHRLRHHVEVHCQPYCDDATEILKLLSRDIPILNQVRADVV